MNSIATTLTPGEMPAVEIRHDSRSTLTPAERMQLLLESSEENDTLTTVRCFVDQQSVTGYVFWRSEGSLGFHALLVPETHRLFVGAGQIMGVFDLERIRLVSLDNPLLFWSFERTQDFVVSYGEVECLLLDLSGAVIDRVDVDPPYEVHHDAKGIRFQSPVYGAQWLRFKSAD